MKYSLSETNDTYIKRLYASKYLLPLRVKVFDIDITHLNIPGQSKHSKAEVQKIGGSL